MPPTRKEVKKTTERGTIIGEQGSVKKLSSSSSNRSSSASPDSSDEEFGAKTFMRQIRDYVHDIEQKDYTMNQDEKEEITEEVIKNNRGKYYITNLSGEYLDGFENNLKRREVVAEIVKGTVKGGAPAFESLAMRSLKKKSKQVEIVQSDFENFQTPKKLRDSSYLNRYISPKGYLNAVAEVSPDDGSPFISTSKDVKVPVEYADHPKKQDARSVAASFPGAASALHPKYSDDGKPKHRLIGFVAVIVHEANDYLARVKADIEKLRTEKSVSGKSSRQKNDQEIIFDKEIDSAQMAGYVPLIYPNLSKDYSTDDQELFGLDTRKRGSLKPEKESPRSLSIHKKTVSIYRVNRNLQWKLAEKHVKNRNGGELIWVDNHGKFKPFRVNQQLESATKEAVRQLEGEFENAPSTVLKPVPESIPKSSGLTEQINRIQDSKEYYSDKDMKELGDILLPSHVHYIDPATATVRTELKQAISNGFHTKEQVIIALHLENHYVGIYLHRDTSTIIYFDPAVLNQEPLHILPANVVSVLPVKVPIIISVSSGIQTISTEGNETGKLNVLDNYHCGPFVLCIMTEMAKENVRLNPNMTGKLQIKFDGSWKDLPELNKSQSNDFGQEIRNCHCNLLASPGTDYDLQIDILRRLIPTPLKTMIDLEKALPKVSRKKPKK